MEASLERVMKCGVGICGSCLIDGFRVCQDGPVADLQKLSELDEFGEWERTSSGKRESYMSYELKIKSERVYREGEFQKLEIGVKDGRIDGVGLDLPPGEEEEDFGNNLVIPGVIDGHVHFREPGETKKEDFRSGSRAAARGGVTTVVDMPNNDPPIKTAKLFREKKRTVEDKSLVNFALYSGIPKDLTEIKDILETGAVGFKYYMAEEEVDLEELSERLDQHGALLAVHAEDPEFLLPDGSPESPSEYLDSRPLKRSFPPSVS